MNRTILYIDDDQDDLTVFTDTMISQDPGVSVITAQNGDEGLRTLHQLLADGQPLPCGIILDMNMPKANGKEVMQVIRNTEQLKHIPIIIFTTSTSVMDMDFCKEHNIPCVTKPMNFSDLESTVSYILGYCCPTA